MKVSIPKPCHENWSEMTPEAKGRFCGVCSKTVVDFTKSTKEEIKDYFVKAAKGKTCGRFKTEDLTPAEPEEIVSHYNFVQKFTVAAFMVFGLTLFSCTSGAQQQHKAKGTVKTPEEIIQLKGDTIVIDTTKKMEALGKFAILSPDTTQKAILTIGEVVAPIPDTTKKCNKPIKNNKTMGGARYTPEEDIDIKETEIEYTTGVAESRREEEIIEIQGDVYIPTYKGKLTIEDSYNKRGKKVGTDYYLKIKGKSYFIKLIDSTIKEDELLPYLNKEMNFNGEILNGLWDTNDPNTQSRIGDYVVIYGIIEN